MCGFLVGWGCLLDPVLQEGGGGRLSSGIRTHNRLLRRQAPYPLLGHRDGVCLDCAGAQQEQQEPRSVHGRGRCGPSSDSSAGCRSVALRGASCRQQYGGKVSSDSSLSLSPPFPPSFLKKKGRWRHRQDSNLTPNGIRTRVVAFKVRSRDHWTMGATISCHDPHDIFIAKPWARHRGVC